MHKSTQLNSYSSLLSETTSILEKVCSLKEKWARWEATKEEVAGERFSSVSLAQSTGRGCQEVGSGCIFTQEPQRSSQSVPDSSAHVSSRDFECWKGSTH